MKFSVCHQRIEVARPEEDDGGLHLCPDCRGTGMRRGRDGGWDEKLPDCRTCRGEGEVGEVELARWADRVQARAGRF